MYKHETPHAVIDFETASSARGSICAVGIVFMNGMSITDTFYSLVDPLCDFSDFCIRVHGITPAHVQGAPTFDRLWKDLEPALSNTKLMAYNASFDINVLKCALDNAGIPAPDLLYGCALNLTKLLHDAPAYSLTSVAADLGITYRAHDALEDAMAAAQVLIHLADVYGVQSIEELMQMAGLPYQSILQSQPASQERPIYQKKQPHSEARPSSQPLEFGTANYFIGKTVAFTGNLSCASRAAAQQAVIDMGGTVKSTVSKKVQVVIVGSYDPDTLSPGNSVGSKLQYAHELIEKGYQLEILDEAAFLSILRHGLDPNDHYVWW